MFVRRRGDGLAVNIGTTCLRAAGSSPAPPAVWAFWRLIWRTMSSDRGLIPLQVFLCQQQGVHTSCGSDLLLFTGLDARA
jgi:hypothetical protein